MSTKVLVIDDSSTARQIARQAMESGGYTVIEAPDGSEALVLVQSESFDCILCDVNMPVMNGVEFLEAVKRSSIAVPPILMLTTESEGDLVRRARELGAVGWMVKPFKPEMLRATVRALVARHTATRAKCAS